MTATLDRSPARTAPAGPLDFELPAALEAHAPPEAEGRRRDDVRLLVASSADTSVRHLSFARLPEVLEAGDLLVVNTSATIPASAGGSRSAGDAVRVHFATPVPGDLWVVELRRPVGGGNRPLHDAVAGEVITLSGGGRIQLLAPWAELAGGGTRLWLAASHLDRPVEAWLADHGQPIRYSHQREAWPLEAYQTVYATEAGSAEMPSAGRPLSAELLTRLLAAGVVIAPLVLHAGLSSLEEGESPTVERYSVPSSTAALVNLTRSRQHRVVAVGTTVVRALETVADDTGIAHPGHGWTDLVLGPERPVRVIDGLLTGWHEPRSSHLRLLEAVAGRPVLERSYRAALAERYRWHEFGDLHLLLGDRLRRSRGGCSHGARDAADGPPTAT